MYCSSIIATDCRACVDVFKKSCNCVISLRIDERRLYVNVSQYLRLINSMSDRSGDVLMTKQSIRLSFLRNRISKWMFFYHHRLFVKYPEMPILAICWLNCLHALKFLSQSSLVFKYTSHKSSKLMQPSVTNGFHAA